MRTWYSKNIYLEISSLSLILCFLYPRYENLYLCQGHLWSTIIVPSSFFLHQHLRTQHRSDAVHHHLQFSNPYMFLVTEIQFCHRNSILPHIQRPFHLHTSFRRHDGVYLTFAMTFFKPDFHVMNQQDQI